MGAPELPPLPACPSVTVVVPARDSAATLPETIACILAQGDVVDELVLAIGPSEDGTAQVAQAAADRDPRVRVVDNPSGRTPDALNVAISASTGQVVVRVDAHSRIPAGYVQQVVDVMRRTGAANVGGQQVPVADVGTARLVAAAMRSRAGSGGAAYRSDGRAGPVDTVYLGAFRREALDDVGGYDPRFTRNQDAELNLRLRRSGYTVWFDPALAVEYTPRASIRALASQYVQYGRFRRLTARVHPGSLAPRQLAAPALVAGLALAGATSAVTRDPRPVGLAAGGYLVALLGAGVAAADRPTDALGVATALGVMHLAWGVGFLAGPPRVDRRPLSSGRPSAGNHGRS